MINICKALKSFVHIYYFC